MTSKLACAALAAALLSFFSCNPNPPATDYGSVKLSLVGSAPDGSRYRLPEGTVLTFVSGAFGLTQVIDGDSSSSLVSLPVGTYETTLWQPDGSTSSDWVLDRIDATGQVIGTVHTTLTTANPLSVTVTSGQTTPLAFDFGVPTGDTITFDSGHVNVTLNVDDIAATSFTFGTNFSFNVLSAAFFNGALVGRLPVAGSSQQLQVTGTLTGPWTELGGTGGDGVTPQFFVCAPIVTQDKIASGTTGWPDLVAETGGPDPISALGGAVLCIIDDGTTNFIRLRLSKTGSPTTATFTDLVAPGQELWFRVQAAGALPSRVYDPQAHTLALGSLMGDYSALTLNNALSTGRVTEVTNGTIGNAWYSSRFNGTMSFSFTGH